MQKIIALLLLSVAPWAVAADVCKEYKPGFISGNTWYKTAAEACAALVSAISSSNPQNTYTLTQAGPGCFISMNGGDPTDWGLSVRNVECGPTQCADDAGQSSVMNFTVGWARSGNPDADDHVGKVVFPNQGRGAACVGGCSWEFTDNGVAAYRSAEPFPASGLHRLSVDFTMRGAGTSCAETPADAAASPTAPEPPCPGFVGEVNGVTKCVGTASQPVPPPDGPTAGRQAGGGEDNGNPAAGKKPDSGEGSGNGGAGRTPSTGNGGNAGGPSGAAGGSKPDGTTAKPEDGKEQQECGAPGQPKCKIDETGTPDGRGAYDEAKAGLDKAEGDFKAGLDAIKSTADKDTSWGVVPSWIAHAECRPWDLGAFEIMGQSFAIVISICDVMPYVVATTSFLWVVATFFLTIAMVFRVTAAPQG